MTTTKPSQEQPAQTSKVLIEAVLAGRRPARIPLFDLLFNDAVIEHFAGSLLDGSDDQRVVYRAVSRALDCARSVRTPACEGVTMTDEAGNIRVSQRWTSWVQKPAFTDAQGWETWMRDYVERAEAGDHLLKRLALTMPNATPQQQTAAAAMQRRMNEDLGGTVFIYCTPSTTLNALIHYLGLDMLSYLWTDCREVVERWLRVYVRETINYIDTTGHSDLSPLAMIYSDVAYNHGPMFSRKMFQEMGFFDEIAAICDACHKRGMKVIFHSDGDIRSLMADLVATGIDGLNPIEAAAGMDVFEIHRNHPKLILVGGVDVTHLLRGNKRGYPKTDAQNDRGNRGRRPVGDRQFDRNRR